MKEPGNARTKSDIALIRKTWKWVQYYFFLKRSMRSPNLRGRIHPTGRWNIPKLCIHSNQSTSALWIISMAHRIVSISISYRPRLPRCLHGYHLDFEGEASSSVSHIAGSWVPSSRWPCPYPKPQVDPRHITCSRGSSCNYKVYYHIRYLSRITLSFTIDRIW